jgi:hypothetical protein
MLVTELVSHPEISALNAQALDIIYNIEVTFDVSQPEISALNAVAEANIAIILVTELTSHLEMSALKSDFDAKPLPQPPIFVT